MSTDAPKSLDTSGLSAGTHRYIQGHYDELAPLLALDDEFYLDDARSVIDESTLKKATNRGIVKKVERHRERGNVFHSWTLDDRAKSVLKDSAPENTLPCGHRVAFEHVEAGYACQVCGSVYDREEVEACL